jgi:hypothetical protein
MIKKGVLLRGVRGLAGACEDEVTVSLAIGGCENCGLDGGYNMINSVQKRV